MWGGKGRNIRSHAWEEIIARRGESQREEKVVSSRIPGVPFYVSSCSDLFSFLAHRTIFSTSSTSNYSKSSKTVLLLTPWPPPPRAQLRARTLLSSGGGPVPPMAPASSHSSGKVEGPRDIREAQGGPRKGKRRREYKMAVPVKGRSRLGRHQ